MNTKLGEVFVCQCRYLSTKSSELAWDLAKVNPLPIVSCDKFGRTRAVRNCLTSLKRVNTAWRGAKKDREAPQLFEPPEGLDHAKTDI